jgi:hypothetical protein
MWPHENVAENTDGTPTGTGSDAAQVDPSCVGRPKDPNPVGSAAVSAACDRHRPLASRGVVLRGMGLALGVADPFDEAATIHPAAGAPPSPLGGREAQTW